VRTSAAIQISTEQAAQEFMLSRGGLRPKTQIGYQRHLRAFARSFPELPLTPQPIQGWLNGLKREGRPDLPLTPETVHSRFRTLRAFYKQYWRWHPDIEKRIPNPMPLVRAPSVPEKAIRIFADQEVYQVFSLSLSPRDRALANLLYDVGPRADECANLTWEDVIPGYVTLRGKTGERIVPVSPTTSRLLEELRPPGASLSDHVFLGKRGPLTYMGIYKLVKGLCHRAGLTGRRCSPHTFRHTFGTNYAAAENCDPSVLQDIMGHKDFKTTLRYIHNNPRRMAKNHQRCTPLKDLASIAQGSLFEPRVVKEAEEILARKGGEGDN